MLVTLVYRTFKNTRYNVLSTTCLRYVCGTCWVLKWLQGWMQACGPTTTRVDTRCVQAELFNYITRNGGCYNVRSKACFSARAVLLVDHTRVSIVEQALAMCWKPASDRDPLHTHQRTSLQDLLAIPCDALACVFRRRIAPACQALTTGTSAASCRSSAPGGLRTKVHKAAS